MIGTSVKKELNYTNESVDLFTPFYDFLCNFFIKLDEDHDYQGN